MTSRRRFWAAAALMLALAPAPPAAAADGQQRVLVIYSTRRDTQFSTLGDRRLQTLLEQGAGHPLDYYAEYIDGARFPEELYRTAFRDYLRLKYAGKHFDLIVTTHRLALQFVSEHRAELFGGTPLVFMTDDPAVKRPPDSAGLIAEPNFGQTFDLIRALQPDTSDVFVVVGSSPRDAVFEHTLQSQVAARLPAVRITLLKGLRSADLEDRLQHLPEHSAVFYLMFYQDGAGVNVNPLDYLDRLTAVANRPVYSWVDSALNRGVVGGSLISIDAQIERVAALASRVLGGTAPDAIPLQVEDLQSDQVDWRQLTRWSIDPHRVPSGTIVRFREPGLFERYRAYVLSALALLCAQTALIIALLVQIRRRRRAEVRLRASEQRLLKSYDRVRDLGGRLIHAQEEERARIARELHDDIGQQVTLLAVDLDQLSADQDAARQDVHRVTRELGDRARDAVRSVHDISHRLYPARLRILGLPAALQSLERQGHGAAHVTVAFDSLPQGIPEDLSLCLYRIAQEAVQNAVKHSRAREISVRLTGTGAGLSLLVADDGVGFDPGAAEGRGVGLGSMRERVEPFGGVFDIMSEAGRGTRIEVFAPLDGRVDPRGTARSAVSEVATG